MQVKIQYFALLMIGCGTGSVLLCWPLSSAVAGELGARITKAVTQSDLGISVRRSVVQGAQTMDRLDLEAERFANQFGLGAARSQQAQRPKPKAIPAFPPPNVNLAHQILEISDKAFCQTISALSAAAFEAVTKDVERQLTKSAKKPPKRTERPAARAVSHEVSPVQQFPSPY